MPRQTPIAPGWCGQQAWVSRSPGGPLSPLDRSRDALDSLPALSALGQLTEREGECRDASGEHDESECRDASRNQPEPSRSELPSQTE